MILPMLQNPLPIFTLTIDPENGSRRTHVIAEFARLGYDFQFIEGVGKNAPELGGLYSRWRNLLWSKRSLTEGEIACYYGHRKAWQAFIDSGAPVGLITEDDFSVINDAAFHDVMANATDSAQWDILKLFDIRPKKIVRTRGWHGLNIVDYKYPASGNQAYLLTREAAQNLLTRKHIFRAVDEDFSHSWEFNIRILSIHPLIVTEISDNVGGSNLETMRSAFRKNKNTFRSLWGMVLQAGKQMRARAFRRKIRNQ